MDIDPPISNWGNSFQLVKNTIEKYVNAHEKYLSARGNLNHFPNLVDLAAERLAASSLDDIPPVILNAYIWRWQKISYPAICRAVLRLSSDMDFMKESAMEGSTKDIDEWILLNERWLRDGSQAQWQQGLVTLSDADSVFSNSVVSPSGRTITRQGPLPGYEVLCDAREPHITIQPSVEAFKRTFEHMSDYLLRNLNWSNLMVAGGIVLGTLLSVDTPYGQPRIDPRWASSDIDIYVYGLTPSEANEKIKNLFATFRANLPASTPTLVVRNSTTITFYARYPLRRVQIVLKLVESPKSVLLNFDLDVCAMGWDGATLWMLPRAARAIETGCSVFTMNLVRGHYLSDRRASTLVRVMKYADKGYGIRFLPSYISSLAGRTRTSRNPVLDGRPLDLSSIAAEQRQRTSDTVQDALNRADSFYATNAFEYLMGRAGISFLEGFNVFMRCVSVWEMERRGEVSLTTINWASNSYEDEFSMYDEAHAPRYKWDPHFDIAEFQQQIVYSNKAEIANWIETDLHDRLFPQGIVNPEDLDDRFQRITCAPSVDEVLSRKKDVMLQVLLPCDFAVYANDLVSQAQAHAGLRETKLLMPMVRQFNFLGAPNPQTDGLFLWRVGKELMWQQLDRRIDEVFEVLYAFRRVNKHLRADPTLQAPRLSKELARGGVDSEFDAFALWVGSN